MGDKVYKIMAQLFSLPENQITDDTSPNDIEKWDSLGHLELVSLLEEEYGIEFDMEQINQIRTVRDIRRITNKIVDKK